MAQVAGPGSRYENYKEYNAFFQAAFGPLGTHGVMGARVHGRRDFTGSTWDDALAWLRGGIIVTVNCQPAPAAPGAIRGTFRKHRIRLHADGTVEPLDCQVTDLDTEAVMSALNSHTSDCVALTLALTRGITRNCLTGGESENSRLKRVGALHAAVGWAQRADTDWSQAASWIDHRVHPSTLDAWLADGWTLKTARPFLLAHARRDLADQWRDAGQTTRAAADLAAKGLRPASTDAWDAAGLSPSRARKWRTDKSTTWAPAEAKRLDDAGFTPNTWRRALREIGFPFNTHSGTPMTEDDLLTWTTAGVPADQVVNWWVQTGGDMDEALAWSATGLSPHAYQRGLTPSTPRRKDPSLDRQAVAAWITAGAPSGDLNMLRAAIGSGISPDEYAAVIGAHPHRDNRGWMFRDRLQAAVRFITAGRPRQRQ